jgi:hypothetical protein
LRHLSWCFPHWGSYWTWNGNFQLTCLWCFRRRLTLQRDGSHSAVGRRRRATLRSGAPPSRRRLTTEKDGIASIGPHVMEEGAATRHGSDRPCGVGPPCARAPWAGSKQAPEDETWPFFHSRGARGPTGHASARAPPRRDELACMYHLPAPPSSLRIAQRTRAHSTLQHRLLCHMGLC